MPVLREPVTRFAHDDGRLTAIELKAASRSSATRSSSSSRCARGPSSPPRSAASATRRGYVVAAPMTRATSVDRVHAAGNCADPSQNVPMAIADGARAGAYINFRLVEDGVVQPR